MFINDHEYFEINSPSGQITGSSWEDGFGGRHTTFNELGRGQTRIDEYDFGDLTQFNIW